MDIDIKKRGVLGYWGLTRSGVAWAFGVSIKWFDNDCSNCGRPEVSFAFAPWRLWWLPSGPGSENCRQK